jgi:hypothetical protein
MTWIYNRSVGNILSTAIVQASMNTFPFTALRSTRARPDFRLDGTLSSRTKGGGSRRAQPDLNCSLVELAAGSGQPF